MGVELNPYCWRWLLPIGLTSILVVACGGNGPGASPQPGAGTSPLTILHFNDFHGSLATANPDTLSFFGTLEEERQSAGEGSTLVLASGDLIGASRFPSFIQGDVPTLKILNLMDLDATAVGNHELDKGFNDLVGRVIPKAAFTYLSANLYQKNTMEPVLPAYALFQRAGVRVGVIGATTQGVPSLVSPAGVSMLDFGDPVMAVNRVTAQLTDGLEVNGEADIIIAAYHEGASREGSLTDQEAESPIFRALVEATSPRVDVIFNGHTHLAYAHQARLPGHASAGMGGSGEETKDATWAGGVGTSLGGGRAQGTRPVLQSGAHAALIGKVRLEIDPATHRVVTSRVENLEPRSGAGSTLPRVKKVAALLDWALAEAAEIGQEEINTLTAAISRALDLAPDGQILDDDRSLESPLTNLVANMYRDRLADSGRGGARIGVQNPGGTRVDLQAGVLTYADAADVLPFANTLMTARLTGAQFKQLLEQQWQPPGASRPYLQLGLSDNVTYSYDPSRAEGDRITAINLDGAPLDGEAEVVVGGSDFLIGGGDNFTVLNRAAERRDSGLSDLEEWVAYLKGSAALSPSFVKRAVQISPTPTTLIIGRPQRISVGVLDFAKVIGAVTNRRLTARIEGIEVSAAQIVAGAADLTLSVPAGVGPGLKTLDITASPTETTLRIPVEVLASGG